MIFISKLRALRHLGNAFLLNLSLATLIAFTQTDQIRANSNGDQWPIDNLIAWWKLDETSGHIMHDSSGFDHNGTLKGLEFMNNGKLERGLVIDKQNSFVDIPYHDGLSTEEISVSTWVKFTSTDEMSHDFIFSLDGEGHTTSGSFFIRRTKDNNKIGFYVSDLKNEKYFVVQSKDNTVKDQWYHLVATLDKKGMKFFINGDLVGHQRCSLKLECQDDEDKNPFIRLGNIYGGTGGPLDGKIDDVRIYRKALNQAEVESLFNVHR